jgi:hypothetical protein
VFHHNADQSILLRNHAVASVWGLIALRLADDEIIPFNYVSYASELVVWHLLFWKLRYATFGTQDKTLIQFTKETETESKFASY